MFFFFVFFFFFFFFFFFSSRRRHTRCREVSWARRCVQETGINAEYMGILREKAAFKLVASLRSLQGTGDEETISSTSKERRGSEERSSWLSELQVKCEKLLELLPANLDSLKRTSSSITNPLFRFLEREITIASHLLDIVRSDLGLLKEMCLGNIKSTNQLRDIAKSLYADIIPQKWKVYNIMSITATEWMIDFNQRLQQFKQLSEQSDFGRSGIWLGGLLIPEAYLTATRQSVSQEYKWSLEELELYMYIGKTEPENEQCFIIKNLSIEGAQWNKDERKIMVGDNLSYSLPVVMFKWVHKSQIPKSGSSMLQVPVYLNSSRSKLLFSVKLESGEMPHYLWYQRGIALFSWNKSQRPVSYTHLTLPTILLVQISVVAVSLKKKKKQQNCTFRSITIMKYQEQDYHMVDEANAAQNM
eukprot:TRINITY_DN41_c0_g1_i10.p1 TRINITY_DN41_c0_g1~~TRINITY_DN41_c0_g1_i10.p1  ORF type:complete len:417 (-),score=90.89 TRINITY_DN41_c0_g1_i10:9-1259(-)